MVRIAPQPFLEGVASQGQADESQGHVSNFVPEVDVRGVQHHRLQATQAEAHTLRSLAKQVPVRMRRVQYCCNHSNPQGEAKEA